MKKLVALWLVLLVAACSPEAPPPPSADPPPAFAAIDTAVGTGEAVVAGKTAVVHYTGWLFDKNAKDHKGEQFDSSRDHGAPFRFPVGAGRVIAGWDEGVVGMQVGGRRTLIIPPDKGYGASGAGGKIPGNATLVFEIELLAIE